MNMKVCPFGTTTAANMTGNVRQEMEYPIVGYTREVEGGPIILLGWIFISDDLKHDYEQVGALGCNGNPSFH